jgi:hypothetical protein
MTGRRKISARRSSRNRKPDSRVGLAAHSPRTGITHVFGDIKEADRLAKLETDLVNSIAFWNWITAISFNVKPDVEWKEPVFRLTYGGFSPRSIIGSVADGGRFNIGGAQLCLELSAVKKAGCLYAASTLSCCYLEASGPTGKPDEFQLAPAKTYMMWDLAKVIANLNRPGLDDLVKASPMAASWAYQKVPMIPQLLAHYLRTLGGDGLVFPSTKDSSALNLAFFFETDDEVRAGFDEQKVGP